MLTPLKNTWVLFTDPLARYCLFNGISEDEKLRIFKLAVEQPFTAKEVAKAYVSVGRDFEALEKLIEEARELFKRTKHLAH